MTSRFSLTRVIFAIRPKIQHKVIFHQAESFAESYRAVLASLKDGWGISQAWPVV